MTEMIGAMNGVSNGHLSTAGGELAAAETRPTESGSPPEWIELIPAGDFNGRDGRGPFRLSNTARVIAATTALRMDAGVPIDYDHATDFGAPEGRPAPAAGWLCAFEERDGALWGKVEWTAHGADAVATREYRYVSPVFEYGEDGEVVRLLRAGLTNNPYLYLTAISAKAGDRMNNRQSDGPNGHETGFMKTFESELREILGLEAESTPQEILAKLRELAVPKDESRAADDGDDRGAGGEGAHSADGGGDPGRYVPLAEFEKVLTELNGMRAAHRRDRAVQAVDGSMREGRLSPSQREWAIAYCQADARGFATFISKQSPLLMIAAETGGGEFRAVRGIRPAGTGAGADGSLARMSSVESSVRARLGIKASEYIIRKSGADDFLAFD